MKEECWALRVGTMARREKGEVSWRVREWEKVGEPEGLRARPNEESTWCWICCDWSRYE